VWQQTATRAAASSNFPKSLFLRSKFKKLRLLNNSNYVIRFRIIGIRDIKRRSLAITSAARIHPAPRMPFKEDFAKCYGNALAQLSERWHWNTDDGCFQDTRNRDTWEHGSILAIYQPHKTMQVRSRYFFT
jgi:hypothetical protein